MYSVLDGIPEEYYIDAAHPYTEEGTVITTNAVVRSISEVLNLEYKEFVLDDEDRLKIKKKIAEVLGI